ncbi:MAG: LacI family transcriptional regulator [Spirochaetales bacterium]|nr:MAG: LacI family transcriptional regulator [Spirochaetales bacterium]
MLKYFIIYQEFTNLKTRLKDVASASGVSLTTASLVLADKGRISEDIREKVKKTAHRLGYFKKEKRERRSKDGSRNLGILINIDYEWAFIWSFIRPIIDEIESTMKPLGLNTVLIPIKRSFPAKEIQRKIAEARVQAVIALHYGTEELVESLEKSGIPVIIVMNNNFQDKFYSVCVDDYQGAYEGTAYLIKLGHTHIAYVEAERPDLPMLLNDRFIGFRKAMEENRLKLSQDSIIRFDMQNMAELKKKLSLLFGSRDRPSAVFCLDDEIAYRVIVFLRELGMSVPEDVSIIAPGDVLDYDQHYYPQITTMRINTTYMGSIVCQMLMNRITHKPEDIHVLKVKQQLVKRSTCREISRT